MQLLYVSSFIIELRFQVSDFLLKLPDRRLFTFDFFLQAGDDSLLGQSG